jgi:hypothetical protein
MENKLKSNYYYEKRGAVLGLLILTALALFNKYLEAPPQWLPITSTWLIVLFCTAAIVVTFVAVMYKRVTALKKRIKNQY